MGFSSFQDADDLPICSRARKVQNSVDDMQQKEIRFFGMIFRTLLPMLSGTRLILSLSELMGASIKVADWVEMRQWCWSSSGEGGFMELWA